MKEWGFFSPLLIMTLILVCLVLCVGVCARRLNGSLANALFLAHAVSSSSLPFSLHLLTPTGGESASSQFRSLASQGFWTDLKVLMGKHGFYLLLFKINVITLNNWVLDCETLHFFSEDPLPFYYTCLGLVYVAVWFQNPLYTLKIENPKELLCLHGSYRYLLYLK